MDVKIGILGKGEEVMNVFPYGDALAIAVRKKGNKVDVFLVKPNADGIPAVDRKLTICEGDGTVETVHGEIKATTF